MKVTSAYANKLIRGYREELAALISSEKDTCTTIYGASETPIETGYDFSSTQAEMDALNDKIAKLRQNIYGICNLFWELRFDVFYGDGGVLYRVMQERDGFCYRVTYYTICYNSDMGFEIIFPSLVLLPCMSLDCKPFSLINHLYKFLFCHIHLLIYILTHFLYYNFLKVKMQNTSQKQKWCHSSKEPTHSCAVGRS